MKIGGGGLGRREGGEGWGGGGGMYLAAERVLAAFGQILVDDGQGVRDVAEAVHELLLVEKGEREGDRGESRTRGGREGGREGGVSDRREMRNGKRVESVRGGRIEKASARKKER